MRTTLLILLILTGSFSGWAQQSNAGAPETVKWTLQECIAYAYKHNIQVRQSELAVLNSELNLRQAKYNRLPNLNASTGVSNNVGRSIDPFTNLPINQEVNSQSYNLNSSVTLFNGFQQVSTIRQSEADAEKANYDLQDVRNNTALNIGNFYLNILLNQEQYTNAELNVELSRQNVDMVEKQVNAGALAQQDLLQARQQLATTEVALIQAENSLDLARLALKQALQLPASTQMEIVVPELDDPSADLLPSDVEVIYEQALNLPVVKSAEAQVVSSEYGIGLARSSRYPSLTLSGGLGTNYSSAAPDQFPDPNSPTGFKENTYMNQLDFNQRRFVSLQLNIPIFNRFAVNTNIGLARLSYENSKLLEQGVRNQLRQNVEQAYYDARAALKTYTATRQQVEALNESFRNATQRRDLGAMSTFEFNQIQNEYNRAQNDLIRAKYDYIFRLKVLDLLQGKPIEL